MFRSDEKSEECILQHIEGLLLDEDGKALRLPRAPHRDQALQATRPIHHQVPYLHIHGVRTERGCHTIA